MLQGKVTISGVENTYGQPFPFSLSSYVFNKENSHLFVGAATVPADEYKHMSLSLAGENDVYFHGIAPEKINLNGEPDQPNPLYGSSVAYISLIGSEPPSPILVTSQEPNRLFLLQTYNIPGSQRLTMSDPLGNTGDVICALGSAPEMFNFIIALRQTTFGADGSSIAIGTLTSDRVEQEGTIKIVTRLVVSNTYPITTIRTVAGVGQPAIIEDYVTIHGSKALGFFYTGLWVTGGSNTTDGVIGVLNSNATQVAPASALETDSIIGGIGANKKVFIHHLGTLLTSTSLHYLIVAGGVGDSSDSVDRQAFALPVVTGNQYAGKLAKKDDAPTNVYTEAPHYLLIQRNFTTPALNPGELFSPQNSADLLKAKIGGTGQLPGPISHIFVEKDTVFAVVATDTAQELGGIFASQVAAFDSEGRIASWTNWRRAGSYPYAIAAGMLHQPDGIFWALQYNESAQIRYVTKTTWGAHFLQQLFPDPVSGTQGLIDFPPTHEAFSQTGDSRVSLTCGTSYEQVVVAQSGSSSDGIFTPAGTVSNPYVSTDGTIGVIPANTDALIFSGGVFDTMKAVVSSTIVSDAEWSWLVVGGNNGVAILAQADGSGWAKGTLGKNFANLPSSSWMRLGSFTQVRKVTANGAFLFILTNTGLYRISMSSTQVALGTDVKIDTIATPETMVNGANSYETFSDLVTSGPVAFLATSAGLFRSGDGQSVQDVSIPLTWQKLELPEGVIPVTRLFAVTATGCEDTLATTGQGGTLYVLSGVVSTHQSRIHRFSILGNLNEKKVSSETIIRIPDFLLKDHPSFYYNRGDYRNYLFTDGAMFWLSRSRYYPFNNAPFVEILGKTLRTGVRSPNVAHTTIIRLTEQQQHAMGPFSWWFAAGTPLIAGSAIMTNG